MGEIILALHPHEHEALKAILRLHIHDRNGVEHYNVVGFVHLCNKAGVELPDAD